MKKIGVLTSGGDSPGMNACIRAVVRSALYYGLEVYGIRRGYQGLIEDRIEPMNTQSVSNIIQRGGTILKTARSKDFQTQDGRKKAFENLRKRAIDGLVVIGGNGTYTGGYIFNEEFGMPVVGAPGTIDNDLYGTEKTIGYDTAINTAINAIDKIRDTADATDRIFFVEVMGRDAGFIAIDTGIGGGAEAILIPEVHTDIEKLIFNIKNGWGRKKSSQLVIVAEGEDAGGVFDVMKRVKDEIDGLDCRAVVLGHIQRGGTPTAADRVLASRFGEAAVKGLLESRKSNAVGILKNEVGYCSLKEAATRKKTINKQLLELSTILSI
jgi:6-phosphofructokinase 1